MSVLEIFNNYPHNIECREGYVEILPKNWKKVTREHKMKLKLLGFKFNEKLKWGDFFLDHFQQSLPENKDKNDN